MQSSKILRKNKLINENTKSNIERLETNKHKPKKENFY